jgi:type II secretory pathway pseudopilin PulG
MLNGGVGAIIALVVVGVIAPSWIKLPDKSREAEVKYYTHTIQIALEMYARDYGGLYPDRIEAIIDESYLATYPENPFTNQPMKNVPYGSPDFEGNFTYLPLKLENGISGYILLGYGYKTTVGECLLDPDQNDHVIIVLSSGSENSLGPEDISSPSLQDAIRSSQQ